MVMSTNILDIEVLPNSEELRAGYKRTEVGVIPEDWTVKPLLSVVELPTGQVDPRCEPYRSRVLVAPDHIEAATGRLLAKETAAEQRAISGKYTFKAGDIIYSKIRPYLRKAILANFDGLCSADMYPLTPSSHVSAGFIFAVILGHHFSTFAEAVSARSGIPKINRNELSDYRIALPPPSEQLAIAAALSDIDALIAALDKLIAKKRDIKQATMQQLLTGQMRLPGFSGEWNQRKLGSICEFLPTANNPRADLSDQGNVEYIHYGDIHSHTSPVLDCRNNNLPHIDRGKIGNASCLEDGDLVMVDASEDLVGVGKSVEVQGTLGRTVVAGLHTILCRGNAEYWALGFKAYLQFIPAFRTALMRVASGISVYAISRKHLENVELLLPSIREQQAIVVILSDMDAEIAALEQRRDKTKHIKQGMMQQLLTGRIRLVEPE
jgi:type I restriction enzyme, S subunit